MESLEKREVLATLVWGPGPSLPTARTDMVAVVGPDSDVAVFGANSTTVSQLGSSASAWSAGPNVDVALKSPGAVTTSTGTVYIYGGLKGNSASDEGWTYDYFAGDNQNIASLNTPRGNLGATVDSLNRAYAIGGLDDSNYVLATVERYSAVGDQWDSIAPLPAARQNVATTIDDADHIYVFGGQSGTGTSGIANTSYRYDVEAGVWNVVAPMPTGTIDSAAVYAPNGSIYVIGGRTSTGAVGTVQVYDPTTNTWSIDTALPTAVYNHAAVIDDLGRIVVAGGTNSAGTSVTTVTRSQRLDIPESAPAITSVPVTAGSLDAPYSYDVNATGNPEATYSFVAAPAGMTIDLRSGLISWQPVEGQTGAISVTVRATNRVGVADQTFVINVLADTTPPTAPTFLAVATANTKSITLSWNASSDNRGVDHYEVLEGFRTGWHGNTTSYRVVKTGIVGTSTTITGLSALTSHKYVVRAVDAIGNKSANSNVVVGTTQSAPVLRYYASGYINSSVAAKANFALTINLTASANPAPTFALVSGPATMAVNATTGVLTWIPTAADVGPQSAVVSATNSVGTSQLTIPIQVAPDLPVLSVQFNPSTGGARSATAGTLFTMQVTDASHTPSTYQLLTSPAGMTIDAVTGLVQWSPTVNDAGQPAVTVRATNSAGSTDVTNSFETFFTGSPTSIQVTSLTALHPTASWTAPTGVGASDVTGYTVLAVARYRSGRTMRSHTVRLDSPGTGTSIELTGLRTGLTYKLYVNAYNAEGQRGVVSTDLVQFVPNPALPVLSYSVLNPNGGPIVAGQPVNIQLANSNLDSAAYSVVSGPAGMTINSVTGLATWLPTAADVGSITATFRATNSVGSRDIVVPVNVLFSGPVSNIVPLRSGDSATVSWVAPTNNVTAIASYQITMQWVWSGVRRSRTIVVPGSQLSTVLALVPTGAVWHEGVTITPVDDFGRLGATSALTYYTA